MGKGISKTFRVCSKHFKDDDFDYPVGSKMFGWKSRRLVRGAVPSKNLPVRPIDAKRPQSQPRVTRQRMETTQPLREIFLPDFRHNMDATVVCSTTQGTDQSSTSAVDAAGKSRAPCTNVAVTTESSCTDNAGISSGMSVADPEATYSDETNYVPQHVEAAARFESIEQVPSQQNLQEELQSLKQDVAVQANTIGELKKQLISISTVKDEQALLAITGIAHFQVFYNICDLVTTVRIKQSSRDFSLSNEDAVLLTFFKLYHNVSFALLGVLFGIHRTTASNIFKEIVPVLRTVLQHAVFWPRKEAVLQCLTKYFDKYRQTRLVLDCTEIEIEQPKDLKSRILTYSHYKKKHTAKILVSETPGGLISYVSQAYGGKASDTYITRESKILEKCLPHIDKVMVDKGFLIDDLCEQHGIELVRPPFLRKQQQLSRRDAENNASIASARVHVERAIQRIKRYKILQQRYPLELLPWLDDIVTIIAGLVNISKPLFASDKLLFQ
ncbi:uncharacterized protein LOC135387913 [Ornithodoros turicata]|uniref:uncharacterized protein LOC135387913 n=1 Tax=Ornithodoros turicata TaxID=34597 RepID=UPI00313A40F9